MSGSVQNVFINSFNPHSSSMVRCYDPIYAYEYEYGCKVDSKGKCQNNFEFKNNETLKRVKLALL